MVSSSPVLNYLTPLDVVLLCLFIAVLILWLLPLGLGKKFMILLAVGVSLGKNRLEGRRTGWR